MTTGLNNAADVAYQRYLETAAWRRTRSAALLRAGNRCAINATHTESLEVVHNTRERLGYELEHDLVVLCAACRRVLAAAAEAERVAVSSRQNVVTLRRVATADGASADLPEEQIVPDVTETWATVQTLPGPPLVASPLPDLVPAPPRYRPWNPAGGSVAPPPPGGQAAPPGEDLDRRGPRRRRRLI